MKNKLLLLFLVILVSLGAKSQINYEDSTVRAITYWGLNESYTYEITQGKNKEGKLAEDGLVRSEVKISVIDSTETSYTIEWRFRNHDIPNLDLMPELKDLLNQKRYVYRINEFGEFEELLNWEEVRDNMLATTKAALKISNALNDSENDQINSFRESLMTKEYVEQKVIEPVNIFHSFFGVQYQLGEVLESEIEIPIPISNIQSIKAQIALWFDSIDEEYNTYTLCYEQKVDQEILKRLMSQFFDKLSNQLNVTNQPNRIDEALDEALKEELDYKVTIYSEFDNTGWPLNIISTTKINIGDNQQNKVIRIRMINND